MQSIYHSFCIQRISDFYSMADCNALKYDFNEFIELGQKQ